MARLELDMGHKSKRNSSAHSCCYASCRYCCKTLFALVTKNSPGCRRDFRVKMWGTSSPDDKLAGDLPNEIEATQIGGFRSDRVIAGKLAPGSFGLLQQYLSTADSCTAAKSVLRSALAAQQNGNGISVPSDLAVPAHPAFNRRARLACSRRANRANGSPP
jgi:hypothetical protein